MCAFFVGCASLSACCSEDLQAEGLAVSGAVRGLAGGDGEGDGAACGGGAFFC